MYKKLTIFRIIQFYNIGKYLARSAIIFQYTRTGKWNKAGLFLGGGFDLLGIQILGVVAIAVFNVGFSFLMFDSLKGLGHLCVIIQDNFEQFISQFFSNIKD